MREKTEDAKILSVLGHNPITKKFFFEIEKDI
jgi:hypothetical protein